MRIVGITGGTGAGKSSAARRFEYHEIAVVDADRIGHDLIAPGGDAVEEIVAVFGEDVLYCGKIDRGRLGTRVFSDPEALNQLNDIMQPRIARKIGEVCASHAESGHRVCLVDAALLGDRGELEPWVESLILVSSAEAERVNRLARHRGMAPEIAWTRVRAQVDPETKRKLASWVIENNGGLDDLHEQVDKIARELKVDGGSSGHESL